MNISLKILPVVLILFDVQSKKLVEKTSCLELAKPSNQQFRLTCRQDLTYHCLLDETFTKEFEVCRVWRWIPEGNCAYFNTYREGNIDGRPCVNSGNVVCPTRQYSSAENTKYTACYVKKIATTIEPRTRILYVTSTGAFNGGNSTYFPKSETNDKQVKRTVWALPIAFVIVISVILVAVVSFFFGSLKCFKQLRKVKSDNEEEDEKKESTDVFNDASENFRWIASPRAHYRLIRDEEKSAGSTFRSVLYTGVDDEENEEESIDVFYDTIEEKKSAGSTFGSVLYTGVDDEVNEEESIDVLYDTIEKEKSAGSTFGSDLYKWFDDKENEEESIDVFNDTIDEEKSAGSTFGSVLYKGVDDEENEEESTDVFNDTIDEEKSAGSTFGLVLYTRVDDEENEEESTDVFDDTIESLQRKAPKNSTDEQDTELCAELYNLLDTEGLKLRQEVMTATIARETGKSVDTLLNHLTNQEKNKLKEIIESKAEHGTSFYVLYSLHLIYLDEELCPKSGWGNPVRGKDIGIADDIERLYRIQTIVRDISNPVTLSVESYIRLLDIMIKALIRLDPGVEFKEDYKLLSYKLESIKSPNLTQTMLKKITDILKKIW